MNVINSAGETINGITKKAGVDISDISYGKNPGWFYRGINTTGFWGTVDAIWLFFQRLAIILCIISLIITIVTAITVWYNKKGGKERLMSGRYYMGPRL